MQTVIIHKIKEYQNYILMCIGGVVLLFGMTYGYLYYKQSREEGAYRALVVAMEYFDAKIKKDDDVEPEGMSFLNKKEFKTPQEKWEKVASVFADAYNRHSSSGIAPIFLAFQAQALVQLEKIASAIKVLKSVVLMATSAEIKDYYQMKLALLLIDMKDIEGGVAILKKIATDDESIAQDGALYHLGNYYWYAKRFDEARNYWNQLLLEFGKDAKHPSPWVPVAQERLRLIDRDVE